MPQRMCWKGRAMFMFVGSLKDKGWLAWARHDVTLTTVLCESRK